MNLSRYRTQPKGSVLVVDDEAVNLDIATAMLTPEGYGVHCVTDPHVVETLVDELAPDVVLLDVMMPGVNGIEVCRRLKANPTTALTPVVLVTALGARSDRLEGLHAGADEFMTKPIDHVELLARVRSFVARSALQRRLHTTEAVVQTLANTLEARDRVTGDHCGRLVRNIDRFAGILGIRADEREVLRWAAMLHDVGKVGVPDAVLAKPGPLTGDEWMLMRDHATIGEAIVGPLDGLGDVATIVRHHHERWDGSGYPDGLAGERIPLPARVLQIVDIFDALTSRRPYKDAMTVDRALEIMGDEAGRVCDPELTTLFSGVAELTMEVEAPLDRNSARAGA